MQIIITEDKWKKCVSIPILADEYIEVGLYNLKLEMKDLGYLNNKNEIILNRTFTLTGFWNNFDYAFSKNLINIIFEKMEETLWKS